MVAERGPVAPCGGATGACGARAPVVSSLIRQKGSFSGVHPARPG